MKKFYLIIIALLLAAATPPAIDAQVLTVGTVSVSFNRPVNATAYTAGDIVRDTSSVNRKAPMFIPVDILPTTAGEIVSVVGSIDTATTTNVSLIFATDTVGVGASLPLDNAAFNPGPLFNKKVIGKIPLRMISTGSGAIEAKTFTGIPFNIAGKKGIGIFVQADSAATPKAGGEYNFRLGFKFYKPQ